MHFDPNNKIIKLCLQGMAAEDSRKPDEAARIFHQAWQEATNDFEKFMAAYYVARHQQNLPDKLKWLQASLKFALLLNNEAVKSALFGLYSNIAQCSEQLGDQANAAEHRRLASATEDSLSDNGPFYHGTKADLQVDDLLTAGGKSNYKTGLVMNHIYFTALPNGAGLAAALADGIGAERVYIVEPTGEFENDPNVTNKKFPGNPTRSYRSKWPLKIVGELTDWARISQEELKKWRAKLSENKGQIIN